MTTLEDVLAPDGVPVQDDAPATLPRKRVWPRLVAGFLFGLVVTICLAGAALIAYDMRLEGRVFPGTSVGAVDLSGLDRDQAAAALTAGFASYGEGRIVIRTSARDVVVPYSDFARKPDVDAMVDEAMRTGREGHAFDRAVAVVRLALSGQSLEPRLSLDSVALTRKIQGAVSQFDLAPVDSLVVKGVNAIYTVPGRAGRTFDGTTAASEAVDAVSQPDAPTEVVVEATEQPVPPTHGDVEAGVAKAAAERMISKLTLTFGTTKWTVSAKRVRSWIQFETNASGAPWPVLDQTKIPGALTKIAKSVQRPPASAQYLKTRAGKIIGVVAANSGQKLDVTGTSAAIVEAIESRISGATAAPVVVKVMKIPPKLSTADALKHAPLMHRLGSWKTWFPVSERNFFGANIWLPAKIIDGTVLYPGQTFEWWRAVGPVNSARGFGPGGFIAGDHTEPTGALGGGMCSSSTTLFNAALRAGLQMGARANHKYYIFRYPLGLDATVSKTRNGTQTVSFTNDTRGPIVIRTFRYTAGGRGWVRYEIWGVPDGRTVSISRPSVSNVLQAITRTESVSTLPTGVREQTEFPANGMDVAVSRVVRDRSGKVIHSDLYRTHYTLWNGIIQIGK